MTGSAQKQKPSHKAGFFNSWCPNPDKNAGSIFALSRPRGKPARASRRDAARISNLFDDGFRAKAKTPAEARVSNLWCPNPESNQGHGDFQSPALPTELFGQRGALNRNGRFASTPFR